MTFKEVFAKIAKGETLSDEDKAFLEKLESDTEAKVNSAAASARRKAEEEIAALKAKLAEQEKAEGERKAKEEEARKAKLSEEQRRTEELRRLGEEITKLKEQNEASAKEAARLKRAQRIDDIRSAKNIKFVSGVDSALVKAAFAQIFDGLESLDDENEITSRVNDFVGRNKAIIEDTTGKGSGLKGNSPKPIDEANNPWAEKSFNLTRQIELEQSNPTEAQRLKALAGKQ